MRGEGEPRKREAKELWGSSPDVVKRCGKLCSYEDETADGLEGLGFPQRRENPGGAEEGSRQMTKRLPLRGQGDSVGQSQSGCMLSLLPCHHLPRKSLALFPSGQHVSKSLITVGNLKLPM